MLWLLTLAWADELEERLAALRSTEDYALVVQLAEEARAAGRPELAVEAWALAEHLSGGNLETAMGPIVDLVATGQGGSARAHAAEAVRLAPELVKPWSLRGWAWRGLAWTPDVGARVASLSYRRAEHNAGEEGSADDACGLAWTRAASGNLTGARAAAARAEVACAPALPHTLTGWGAVFGAVSAWQGTPYRSTGGHAVLQGGLSWDEWLDLELTGRFSSIATVDLAGETGPIHQGEGWGRVTVRHAGLGASLLVGGLGLDGQATGKGVTVGGSLWGTWGVRLAAHGAWTSYNDGPAWQAGGTLAVPLRSWLTLSGGVGATAWTPNDEATLTVDGGPHVSGHLGVALTQGPVDLSLSGTFGQEVRPIRLDEPTVYNLGSLVAGTGSFDLGVRVGGPVTLRASYDLMHLAPEAETPVYLHLATLGVVISTTRPLQGEDR